MPRQTKDQASKQRGNHVRRSSNSRPSDLTKVETVRREILALIAEGVSAQAGPPPQELTEEEDRQANLRLAAMLQNMAEPSLEIAFEARVRGYRECFREYDEHVRGDVGQADAPQDGKPRPEGLDTMKSVATTRNDLRGSCKPRANCIAKLPPSEVAARRPEDVELGHGIMPQVIRKLDSLSDRKCGSAEREVLLHEAQGMLAKLTVNARQ